MENFLIYIGKAALAAGAFYLLFLVLFQHQKHFRFNRIYLPVSLAVSFIIPIITFTKIQYIESSSVANNSFAFLPEMFQNYEATAFQLEWYHYLFCIYIFGVLGFLFYLITGHAKAISLVKNSWLKKLFEINVNITSKDVHPFSFFHKIVLSEKTLQNPNLQLIVEHENIHVKEKHTLDILFAELLFLLQWFNPFAWLLKDAIKNNLEYKTDQQIVEKHNPQTYQLAMVGLADKKGVAPFLTALNGSQLKNRIIMMKKKTENKYTFVKQLLVLPLLAILVMGLSNKEVKTEIVPTANQVEILNDGKVINGKVTDPNGDPIPGASIIVKGKTVGTITNSEGQYQLNLENSDATLVFLMVDYQMKEVQLAGQSELNVELIPDKNSNSNQKTTIQGEEVFFKVEEMPQFPGGEKALKKYIEHAVIYPEIALENGIQGIVYVNFIIAKDGKVTNANIARGVDPSLDKEALRVVSALPRWKPGRQRGKIVNTSYTVPVEFRPTLNQIHSQNKVDLDGKPLKKEEQSKLKETTVVGYPSENRNKKDEIIRIRPNMENEPLYIVDGKEVEDITDLDPVDIESISVLKDKSATELYGEKGKNGVICIETKFKEKLNDKLIIVDGKEFDGELNDISPDEIASVSVLKDVNTTTKIYGEKASKGVIIINTKTKYNSSKPEPLIIVNGKETKQKINDIDPETIESVNVLKDKSATEKYGEKGENGGVEISLKPEKIDTDLKLRKFIAYHIKYPVVAQEANKEETVNLAVKFDNNGKIKQISENDTKLNIYKKADFMLDEVVVVALSIVKKGADNPTKGKVKTSEENPHTLLVNEAKRVIQKIPEIDIEEFKGKTVGFTLKFVLQE